MENLSAWSGNGGASAEANDLGGGKEADRSGTARTLGKAESGEEGGVVSRGACCGEFAVGFCVWVRRSTLCVVKLLES
jgi:hypothetical protein